MAFPIDGGVGVAKQSGDGPLAAVSYFGPLLRQAAEEAWADYRPDLQTFLTTQLGAGNLIADGVTLYDIHIDLAPDIALSAERDENGDLVIHLSTGVNHVGATSTQPTPLGKWADPAFDFYFGLDLTYRLDLPPVTQPIAATGFESITVLSPSLHPGNFVADVLFVLDAIWGWISGTDYVQLLERFIANTDFAPYVNKALQPVNDLLTQLAADGFWFLDAVVDALDGSSGGLHGLSLPGAPADRTELLLTTRGYDQSGVVQGEVHWPLSLGHATNVTTPSFAVAARASVNAAAVAAMQPAVVAAATPQAIPAAAVAELAKHDPVDGSTAIRSAPAPTGPIATALVKLPAADAAKAATELRAGVTSRFTALAGATLAASLRQEFMRGASDLSVKITTHIADGVSFGTDRPTGSLASLWIADDDTTGRRRYTMRGVATEAPLMVTCALADGYHWTGQTNSVAAEPDGWKGTVTVHKASQIDLGKAIRSRVAVHTAVSAAAADKAALNPQPLPPKAVASTPSNAATKVSLNPQPLPPKTTTISHAGTVAAAAKTQVAGVQTTAPKTSAAKQVIGETQNVVTHIPTVVNNPTGNGVVTDIDFEIQPYVAPVVR
jgi:hypothetical protein